MTLTSSATDLLPALRRRRNGSPDVLKAGIFGIGTALPEQLLTNAHWEERLDTTDTWIARRTGIRQRFWLRDGEGLAPLAAQACLLALDDAGRTPDEVDQVIVSTITPDLITPGLAPDVAHRIGATRASAVDINAACSGFMFALDQAAALVESGRARVVLVCAAEALSRITDADDRGTAVLFGDGAGAVVVCGAELDLGIGRFELGSDGDKASLLYADQKDRLLRMSGQEVYRHAVARMVEATRVVLGRARLSADELDLFVAHQANARIVEAAALELGIDRSKVVLDVDRVANTSSASIPLALHRAEQEGRLRPGAVVGLAAFGAGFVWGAGIISWKERVHVCA